jgi:hypothetical protein
VEGIIIIRAVPVDHMLEHTRTSDVATLSHMPHEHHRSVAGLCGLVPKWDPYVREWSGVALSVRNYSSENAATGVVRLGRRDYRGPADCQWRVKFRSA